LREIGKQIKETFSPNAHGNHKVYVCHFEKQFLILIHSN
jgi:hypothetical protein